MKFGIVGLGLMGGNLARAALERGLESWGSTSTRASGGKLADDGLEAVPSLELLVASGRSSVVRRR
jgi:3-hydroxyisobutyrate dehydrogenase-like beta-hydroxyacid dehydrogenase